MYGAHTGRKPKTSTKNLKNGQFKKISLDQKPEVRIIIKSLIRKENTHG